MLSQRALNRALLARQLLLERASLSVMDTVEHLVGLQAQAPNPPYLGLFTRLAEFQHDTLSQLMRDRAIVRMALMRSTLHLVSARDGLTLRAILQPTLERAAKGGYGTRLEGMDFDALTRVTRTLVEEQPRTFNELGALLVAHWPDRDRDAMTYAARALVPLVQIPPRGLWGEGGQAVHACVDTWLGQPLPDHAELSELILRYLRAFGPATVNDVQAWSGLTRLKEPLDQLRPKLQVFRNDNGQELFDLPDCPRPHADTPAPVRFLGEFDNILLAHDDRSRIISEMYRRRVYTANGIVRATVLVDGFVAGQWRVAQENDRATLQIEPFRKFSPAERDALTAEGDRMVRFVAAPAKEYCVRVVRAIKR